MFQVVILLLSVTFALCNADYISGIAATIMTCANDGDCNVDCLASYGCSYSTINCPSNGHCTVDCSMTYGCNYATINASPGYSLRVICDASYGCNFANINGADDASLSVECATATPYSCNQVKLEAISASDCTVTGCSAGYAV